MARAANHLAKESLIDVAAAATGKSCAGDPAVASCNCAMFVDEAFTKLALPFSQPAEQGYLYATELFTHVVTNRRPVAIVWQYSAGGHVGLVVGYSASEKKWCLFDPWNGAEWLDMDELSSHRGDGKWSETYFEIGAPLEVLDGANPQDAARMRANGVPDFDADLTTLERSLDTKPVPIWRLSDARGVAGEVSELAEPSQRFHLNLHESEAATTILPTPDGTALWRVTAVGRSNISSAFEETLQRLQSEGRVAEREVRLLWAPSILVHAIWLSGRGEDSFIIIDAPKTPNGFDLSKAYSSTEFLAIAGQMDSAYAPSRK